jgi:hypothetical protein
MSHGQKLIIARKYLQEALGEAEADSAASGGIAATPKINRQTLEGKILSSEGLVMERPTSDADEARESTLRGHGTPGERYSNP